MSVYLHLTYFQNEPGAAHIKHAYSATTLLMKYNDVWLNYWQWTGAAQDGAGVGVWALIVKFKKEYICNLNCFLNYGFFFKWIELKINRK